MAMRPMVTAAFFLMLPIAGAAQTPAGGAGGLVLPPVDVIAASPLLGIGLDRNKVPAATNVLTGADVTRTGIPGMLQALDQQVGGVALDDAQGNAYQPNLMYRGFSASPLDGDPQGLAVYLNGVRFNQPFGDAVNWDLLPDIAIDRLNLEGSNPVFGLNALGGSLSIQLKNGFTFHGGSAELHGGAFGTISSSFQYGQQSGNTSAYVAATVSHSDGWRQFNQSDVRQFYGDLGWRGERAETHLTIMLADNALNGPGTSPVQLLQVDRGAAFTSPNLTTNRYGLVSLSTSWDLTDQTSLQGLLYYSNFSQRIANGNVPDAQPCAGTPGFLCTNDGALLYGRGANPVADFLNGGPYSQLNAQGVDTNGYGASLQATHEGTIAGLHNHLIAGLSFDGGITDFSASTAIGGLDANRLFVGPGIIIDQPDGSIAPVRVGIVNAYYGAYVADTLDVTHALSLSLSGRMNIAQLDLNGGSNAALTGQHGFAHFNPGVGFTYRLAPALSLYAGYSEANRAPTPAELSCASAQSPCTLANFFVGDPALKQVIAHTVEAGLRGRARPFKDATLDWTADVYRTDSGDDILYVASSLPGFAYFQNIGQTRRQGIEAGVTLRYARFRAWLNYAFTDATFGTALTLDSPLNPGANANGQIHVTPGDRLPGVPRNRLKFGMSYGVTDAWTVGVSGVASSGQYLFGDEANLTPQTGAYVVLDANTSYQVCRHVQLFALVQNVLNAQYATYGTFSDTSAIPIPSMPDASVTRSLSPAAPIALYGGVRVTF
ncbi:MAG TPA: TonB-dependent receptor [Acetobacteraceae bacterium]|nr:TonB-dependent receptor [Acetobacteraceae bacterium]